jgi:hypothetical protein
VTLTATARCHRCGQIAEGDPAAVDRAASKHHKDTGHPVATVTEAK